VLYLLVILCEIPTESYQPENMDYKFINMEYLDSVSGGDPGIIKEILIIFKEQSVEIYNEMKSLLVSKNYTSLGLLAHKAKSSVAIMGMNELADMLKTFEIQARDGKESHLYESYLERFNSETQVAIKELDDLINNRLKNN
jgi:HPt (histidine-containing phosphotransfer) domain-containing protein